jgi:hypothetical protein
MNEKLKRSFVGWLGVIMLMAGIWMSVMFFARGARIEEKGELFAALACSFFAFALIGAASNSSPFVQRSLRDAFKTMCLILGICSLGATLLVFAGLQALGVYQADNAELTCQFFAINGYLYIGLYIGLCFLAREKIRRVYALLLAALIILVAGLILMPSLWELLLYGAVFLYEQLDRKGQRIMKAVMWFALIGVGVFALMMESKGIAAVCHVGAIIWLMLEKEDFMERLVREELFSFMKSDD